MDLHVLAKQIALEILNNFESKVRPVRVRALCDRDPDVAAALRDAVGQEYEVVFLDDAPDSDAVERTIVPRLTCLAMADLASGRASDKQARAILDHLLAGRKVEVLAYEYEAYCQTAPGPLYSLYETYRKTLESYGLKSFKDSRPESLRFRDTLITAETVREAARNGVRRLIVQSKALITPAALETAGELGVGIEKEE